MADSDVYALMEAILSISYPLGMLITAFLVLLLIKLSNCLWPDLPKPPRKHALLIAAVVSMYGPIGILSMTVIILVTVLVKLLDPVFSNNWWDKPL